LAECPYSETELLPVLNRGSALSVYVDRFDPAPKLKFFTRYPPDSVGLVDDEGGLSARLVKPPIGIEVLLIGVHLPSKLHMSDAEQTLHATRVANFIRRVEEKSGNSNSLLLGDFNMDPFEDGMVAADGIHGVMDRDIARKLSRTVKGERRTFFYNPMWSRLGDESEGPPGTFYYRGGQLSRFWHTFDQALLRPSLIDYYSRSGLRVLTKVGSKDLVSRGKIDGDVSDHLPLLVTLEIEQGVGPS
jgi:hypothetical protein